MSSDCSLPSLHVGRWLFVIFAAILFSSSVAMAGDKAAVRKLSEIRLFAFGGIGDDGITSNGEIAFKSVFASDSAEADFLQILKTGTPQGQCYALVGLRLKNRLEFDEQVKRFASSKDRVQTCAGCELATLPMSWVVAKIQHGSYDESAKAKLRSPR
jgi:hypothetical protein